MKSVPLSLLLALLVGLMLVTAHEAAAAPGDPRSISRSNVNVRTGPSLDAPILITINAGETMVEIAAEGDWYLLNFPGRNQEGWIYGPLLDPISSAASVETTTTPTANKATARQPSPARNLFARSGEQKVASRTAGDPANGEKVFYKCGACHTTVPGVNAQGPSLVGVFGSRPAQAPGFGYSSAMREFAASGIIWNAETLDQFIRRPGRYVRGTSMPFSGIRDPKDRRDLIAYLSSLNG